MSTRFPGARRAGGFTLIEVVLGAALLAIVLLGTQSALMIASRAIPDPKRDGPSLAAAGGLGWLADDIAVATSISAATGTALELVVPDATGDGTPDTVRYAWSGQAGDALTRAVNGGAAAVLVEDVREFVLAYDTRSAALPQAWTTEPVTTLLSFTPSSSLDDKSITMSSWRSQYLTPSLPADAVSWSVTGVRFWARKRGSTDTQVRVQVRSEYGRVPSGRILAEAVVNESSLTVPYGPVDCAYSHCTGLAPGQGIAVVFAPFTGADGIDLRVQTSSSTATMQLARSNDGGASWTLLGENLPIVVSGRVTTPAAPAYETLLTGVRCRLRAGADGAPTYSAAWRALGEPRMP